MPAISFSGTTSRGPFWLQIFRHEKTQTCRAPRADGRDIRKGDKVILYWKQRMPIKKKPVHLIGEAIVTSAEMHHYMSFAYDDAFARRDGFEDHLELQSWFGSPKIHGHELYNVIQFDVYSLAALEMICKKCGWNKITSVPEERVCPKCQGELLILTAFFGTQSFKIPTLRMGK